MYQYSDQEIDEYEKSVNLLCDMNNIETNKVLRGLHRINEPMANRTSWHAGGVAAQYIEPDDVEDLCNFLKQVPDGEPIMWIGLGSNLLIRDGGFPGTVISSARMLNRIEILAGEIIYVESGVPCAKIARQSAKSGLTGAEFLAGIPGTMGGALAMNAGAFDHETWDIVLSVEVITRKGQRKKIPRQKFEAGYREVKMNKDEWFIATELQLQPDMPERAEKRIREFLEKRSTTQPMGKFSCGSVFRNPSGDFAARLIEKSGLKGKKIGGAMVSEKHANFIINNGNATAGDIEALINHIQVIVKREHDVELIPEVQIVGNH